jgi:hypothetical protein
LLLGSSPIPVVEAEVTAADVTYVNVSIEAEGGHTLDSSTHSVVYPLDDRGAVGRQQQIHESQYRSGDGEDYGSPETEQEARARLEAENFVQGESIKLLV